MVQRTIDRKELERKYAVVGVPVSEAPNARKGPGSQALQSFHQGNREILFGLQWKPYFPFYVTKQDAQNLLKEVIPTIPIAFDVRGSPSSKPTYVVKPRDRLEILDSLTAQVPKQLYLRSQEIVRRCSDTREISEDEVLHRLWIEGNSLFRFFDAGVSLEAKYKNIRGVDFTKAHFRGDYECHGSTRALLQGANSTSILDRAIQEARKEEKVRREKARQEVISYEI